MDHDRVRVRGGKCCDCARLDQRQDVGRRSRRVGRTGRPVGFGVGAAGKLLRHRRVGDRTVLVLEIIAARDLQDRGQRSDTTNIGLAHGE
jgi:hypothetical protein